jgi:hypothetical protein
MRNVLFEIEQTLSTLVGQTIRVQVHRFSPDGRIFTPTSELVFPNGTRAENVSVFFEGELHAFERRIGVILVALGENTVCGHAEDGLFTLRTKLAGIVSGPAVVEMAFPFRLEHVPRDEENYWGDIRFPSFQFELPFDPQTRR